MSGNLVVTWTDESGRDRVSLHGATSAALRGDAPLPVLPAGYLVVGQLDADDIPTGDVSVEEIVNATKPIKKAKKNNGNGNKARA